jgi:FtsH-binding integral membrane protein
VKLRLFLPPTIAFVWLFISALSAAMQRKYDAITYKTLVFGFLLWTAVFYVMMWVHPFMDSPIRMAIVVLAMLGSMYWFRKRLQRHATGKLGGPRSGSPESPK